MSIVELNNICKKYGDKEIFKNFNLKVEDGDFVSIMGVSGSGKSTLLNIIGMLEKADSGDIEILGVKNPKFNSRNGIKLLRNGMSYLFQNYGLVNSESVLYNLKIATKYLECSKSEKSQRIAEALEKVGLSGFEKKKIYQLSGGEQQRVAMAKIILKSSKLILADEPTGSLDADNRKDVLNLLNEMNKNGSTVIVVTHDPIVDEYATVHIKL